VALSVEYLVGPMGFADLEVGLASGGPDVLHVDLADRNVQRVAGRAEDIGVVSAPDAVRSTLSERELLQTGGVLHAPRRNAFMPSETSDEIAGDRLRLFVRAGERTDARAPPLSSVCPILSRGPLDDPVLDGAIAKLELGGLHHEPVARSLAGSG